MIIKFLRAKHWQIFVLIFGIPFIMQLSIMGNLFAEIPQGNVNEEFPGEVFRAFKLLPIVMGIYIFSFFSWIYSIAIGLQRKLPPELKMSTNRFKIFFYISAVYITCIIIGMYMMFGNNSFGMNLTPSLIGPWFALLFPIHLFSMFCMFYIFYFVSKTFKTLELKREVNFSDYAGEFFLIWFYVIGVWILQPKINKMAESQPIEPMISNRD